MDIVAVLVKKAGFSGVYTIFLMVQPWFIGSDGMLQKKAFRVLEEIYKRRTEDSLSEFFEICADELKKIMEQVCSSSLSSSCLF